MGDVVLAELIAESPAAKAKMDEAIIAQQNLDIYVVIAKEERRADALAQIQALRDQNYRVDYSFDAAKGRKTISDRRATGRAPGDSVRRRVAAIENQRLVHWRPEPCSARTTCLSVSPLSCPGMGRQVDVVALLPAAPKQCEGGSKRPELRDPKRRRFQKRHYI